MTVWIAGPVVEKTTHLLAEILIRCKAGERVQFLASAGTGEAVVQRLRVALSRSRKRNEARGRRIEEFTLRHQIYSYTHSGIRHDAIVMWIEKHQHHVAREILDDLLER